MKVLKKDELKARQEQLEKEFKIADSERRDSYFTKLRKDRNFQKYVVEDIIRKNISELTDTRKIAKAYQAAGGNMDKKDELGGLVIESIMAAQQLEKIFGEIMN